MTTTDRMAPSWMMTLKALEKPSGSSFTNWLTRMRWPVDETGKNSVMPSTRDRIRTLIRFSIIEIPP